MTEAMVTIRSRYVRCHIRPHYVSTLLCASAFIERLICSLSSRL